MDDFVKKCVQSATVSPHWLPDENVFWYRRYLDAGKFQYVVVDVSQKRRFPAFDHEELAKALESQTDEVIDKDALPFQSIELGPDASYVRFQFLNRKWQYGPGDSLEEWKGEFTQIASSLLRREVPSSKSTDQISVDFVNRTGAALTMFWIDWNGKPIYYNTLAVGGTERQHTYAGHVWRLVDELTGKAKAIYSAPDQANDLVIIEDLGDIPEDALLPEAGKTPQQESQTSESESEDLVLVRDFNVWLRKQDGEEIQLSINGTKENPYDEDHIDLSSNKRHAIVWQYVPSQDHEVTLIESSPDDQIQPKVHKVQYLKPGDRRRIDRPRLFDLEKQWEVPTDDALFKNPYKLVNLGWNKTDDEFRFYFNERGHSHLRIIAINLEGKVRTVVEESSSTFVDYTKLNFEILPSDNEMLWTSERDGYNHLYLIDLAKGVVKNQITKGDWNVSLVESADDDERRILFRGYGMRPDEDPYHAHLASVNFDGSDFRILTDGDGAHSWSWSPDKKYLIDTWSRVDLPPRTVLRDGKSGEMIIELEGTNVDNPEEVDWNPPERFSAFGRDGKTLVYGIIIRPSNLDKDKKYPVIDDIYAGPQDFFTPKSFSALRGQRKWADQGYIVVRVDGMGTNWRGKAFHDVCYKNLRDSGLPDHISWLKAAAETRPWMDLSRVGIMGSSAGGQSAVSALLHHNDFYKAAAADSGCHDNRMDKMWWNELWMGYPVDDAYADSSNVTHAAKLKGALMLIVGELDDNVDPSSTMQLVNALHNAKKYYELLFVPGGEHGCGSSPYAVARQREFFRRHLQQRSSGDPDPSDILDV